MQRFRDSVQLSTGRAIAGAVVTVTEYPSGDAATIYSDDGVTAYPSNIISTDATGEYTFYAANGRYTIKVTTVFGIDYATDVILYDPDDVASTNVGEDRVLGRVEAGEGPPSGLTITQVLDMIDSSVNVGDIIYRGIDGWTRLAAGTPGYVLSTNGVAAPSWLAVGGVGTVTSVAATVPSFLSISGSPVTGSGTLAITANAGNAVGAFLGTPSSANLAAAVTDETGTGALVFASSPTLVTPALGTPSSGSLGNCTGYTESIIIACGDESTACTTGTAKVTLRMPYACTLVDVRASLTTAPTGSTFIFDINENGTSVLSTKLSIDISEKTSTTAATAAVISDSALADDAEITIDFDQVGSTVAGAGPKVTLIVRRT